MPAQRRYALANAVLLIPATLLALFHRQMLPLAAAGLHKMTGDRPLAQGFDYLQDYGFVVYLLPVAVAFVSALSWRIRLLQNPFSIAWSGCVVALVCVLYLFLLSTSVIGFALQL